MRIAILDRAERDLIEGFHFYERQKVGLGSYFLANLYADIESLKIYAGIHNKPYKHYHRLLSRRFPFAVFYKKQGDEILFMRFSIVEKTRHGSEQDLTSCNHNPFRIAHALPACRPYIQRRLLLNHRSARRTRPAI
jgi:hypothetical protein